MTFCAAGANGVDGNAAQRTAKTLTDAEGEIAFPCLEYVLSLMRSMKSCCMVLRGDGADW